MLASYGDALIASPPTGPPRFATVAEDGLLTLFDVGSGQLLQQHARPTHLAVKWTCIAWWMDPADEALGLLALGTDSGLVVIWDLALGRVSHELRAHTQHVLDVAFEAGGGTLLSTSKDRQVCCHRVATGELVHTFSAGQAAVHRLSPTGAGEHVLLGASALRLVRRDTWKRAGKAPGHASRVSCLCLSADDRLAASAAADDRHVSLWRVAPSALASESGEPCVQTLALETRIVQLAFYRPSGASGEGREHAVAKDGSPPSRYTLLVLTASGDLGVWSFAESAAFAKDGKSPAKSAAAKKKKKAGAADAPPLPPKPQCVVRVASGGTDVPEEDPQRIFRAAFCGPHSVVVAHGSQVQPTFTRVNLAAADGGLAPSVQLPRADGGVFAPGGGVGEGGGSAAAAPSRKSKRGREQQLGAQDVALPSQRKGRSAAGAADEAADGSDGEGDKGGKAGEAAAEQVRAAKEASAAAKTAAAAVLLGGEGEEGEEGEEVVAEEVGGLPSFGQRLAAMELGGGESASGAAGGSVTKRKPTAASQVALLVQALQNGDHGMIDEVLLIQDAGTIASTIARLPTTSVLPFLEAVLQRVRGRPARVASLASWMRALLAQHAAYLMGCPQLLPMLTPLYQLIEERLTAFKPLLKLVGRMQMLQSQIAAQQAATQLEGTDAPSDPVLVFDEAEEEEEARAAAEGEDGEEDGEEDFDDDDEDEDGEEDDDEDGEEDGDDMFGEGGDDEEDDSEDGLGF